MYEDRSPLAGIGMRIDLRWLGSASETYEDRSPLAGIVFGGPPMVLGHGSLRAGGAHAYP